MGDGILDTISTEYDNAVQTWRGKVAQFQQALAQFIDNRSDAVALGFGQEWNELYSRASAAQSTLTYIANALESAYSWVRDVFGMSGMGRLGVVPMIPVAVVTGSIAALAYIISDLMKFNQKIALAKTANYSPSQVNEMLESGGIISNAASRNLMLTVLIGGAALYFLPRLMKGK